MNSPVDNVMLDIFQFESRNVVAVISSLTCFGVAYIRSFYKQGFDSVWTQAMFDLEHLRCCMECPSVTQCQHIKFPLYFHGRCEAWKFQYAFESQIL